MIPKVIHYCWFGKKPIPQKLQKCIASWKKLLPDYQIIEWNEDNFNLNSTRWTKQAYAAKKYAFVADYVRMKVLYEYGGIYLDTDVEIVKNFDVFLQYKAFGGFEPYDTVTTGVMGAEKGHHLIKEFLDYYTDRPFIKGNGKYDELANVYWIRDICQSHGLVMNNTYQVVEDFHFFPKTYFSPLDVWKNKDLTKNTYAIHYFEGSWLDEETRRRIKRESFPLRKNIMKMVNFAAEVYHHRIKKDR